MRAILKTGLLVITVETEDETATFAAWRAAAGGHVFLVSAGSDTGISLHDLGSRDEACRTPLNIVFDQCDARWQPISNLALAPFVLDGKPYSSVEAFWQGLKFESDADRARAADLWGVEARRVAARLPEQATFRYDSAIHATGAHGHHALMERACRAKFAQNLAAREAPLATKDRLLVHRTRRDSKTIPGALMADIWMRIRADLRDGKSRHGIVERDDGRILFFGRDRDTFGFLSHFHPAPVALDGESWPSVEHFYQAQKSHDPAYRVAIRACTTPGEAKRLAARPDPRDPSTRQSWFATSGHVPRPDWAEVKLDIMRRADLAKFTQHPDLAASLRATGGKELVEDAPSEPYWGIGRDGAGLNWAGRVLMEIREALGRPPTLSPDPSAR